VQQFVAHRFGESLDGVLGAAIGALQRDSPIGESRTDLDDDASVADPHSLQGSVGSVDEAEVAHLGGPAELFWRRLDEGREDGAECDVDPDVDRAEFVLHARRGGIDRCELGDVCLDGQRAPAGAFDVRGCRVQSLLPAGDQADVGAARTVCPCGCPAHTATCSGDYDGLVLGFHVRQLSRLVGQIRTAVLMSCRSSIWDVKSMADTVADVLLARLREWGVEQVQVRAL
jgi:hypothetical protein